jgi:hypothetical protein
VRVAAPVALRADAESIGPISNSQCLICSSPGQRQPIHLGYFLGNSIPPTGIARHRRHRTLGILRKKQPHAAREFVVQKARFFVDQQFGVAVVAHGHRHVYPRPAGDALERLLAIYV